MHLVRDVLAQILRDLGLPDPAAVVQADAEDPAIFAVKVDEAVNGQRPTPAKALAIDSAVSSVSMTSAHVSELAG